MSRLNLLKCFSVYAAVLGGSVSAFTSAVAPDAFDPYEGANEGGLEMKMQVVPERITGQLPEAEVLKFIQTKNVDEDQATKMISDNIIKYHIAGYLSSTFMNQPQCNNLPSEQQSFIRRREVSLQEQSNIRFILAVLENSTTTHFSLQDLERLDKISHNIDMKLSGYSKIRSVVALLRNPTAGDYSLLLHHAQGDNLRRNKIFDEYYRELPDSIIGNDLVVGIWTKAKLGKYDEVFAFLIKYRNLDSLDWIKRFSVEGLVKLSFNNRRYDATLRFIDYLPYQYALPKKTFLYLMNASLRLNAYDVSADFIKKIGQYNGSYWERRHRFRLIQNAYIERGKYDLALLVSRQFSESHPGEYISPSSWEDYLILKQYSLNKWIKSLSIFGRFQGSA